MCNCSKKAPGERRRLAGPRARTLYGVFDGETQVAGPYRSVGAADARRLRLCSQIEGECALVVREAA